MGVIRQTRYRNTELGHIRTYIYELSSKFGATCTRGLLAAKLDSTIRRGITQCIIKLLERD